MPSKLISGLRCGSIIKSMFNNSNGVGYAGPHYAVIIDSDETIAESDPLYVVVISNNSTIEPEYLVPIPARLKLTGFVHCSWLTTVLKDSITEIAVG